MDDEHRKILKSNLVSLVNGLTLDEGFIANLESEGILITSMVEELIVSTNSFVVKSRGIIDPCFVLQLFLIFFNFICFNDVLCYQYQLLHKPSKCYDVLCCMHHKISSIKVNSYLILFIQLEEIDFLPNIE